MSAISGPPGVEPARAAALLIAGISLLDATLAANQGYTALAILALGAFALTQRPQRAMFDT